MVNSVNSPQNIANDVILFDYSGIYSNEMIQEYLDLTEQKLSQMETSLKTRKKVFSILVEVYQNLFHHYYNTWDQEFSDEHKVMLTLKKLGDSYLICAGNPIAAEKVETLKKRIEQLNKLSATEIRELYRKRLNNGIFSESGGAGLGMIDIVRKSGEKINYQFKDVNQNFSFFKFEVKVSA